MTTPRGFTLLQTIVTMGITTFLLFAVLTFQKDLFTLDRVLRNGLITQSDARRTLKAMSDAARAATIAETGAYPILQAGTSSFTFYSDTDKNGVAERIRYFLNGTNLQRGTIVPTGNPLTYSTGNEVVTTVLTNVTNGATPIFEYFGSTYDGTTAPLAQPVTAIAVRHIRFTLVVDSGGAQQSPGPATFRTEVTLRTLKDNL